MTTKSLIVFIPWLLFLSACGLIGNTEQQAQTLVAQTVAAWTATPVPSDTPQPTETPVPATPTDTPTETPTPTATPTATLDLAATAAFESTQLAEAVLALVEDELAKYNISTASGFLAWTEPEPIVVLNNVPGTYLSRPIDEGEVYSTYVLHTILTWESVTGLAGCGIIFHSEKNLQSGEQYRFHLLRLSGLPAWDVELWNFGSAQAVTTGQIKVNSAINQGFGDENELVVISTKGLVAFYANGTRLSNVIVNTRSEGRIGYFGFQESGVTNCSYSDNWIWVLEE